MLELLEDSQLDWLLVLLLADEVLDDVELEILLVDELAELDSLLADDCELDTLLDELVLDSLELVLLALDETLDELLDVESDETLEPEVLCDEALVSEQA